MGLTVRGRRKDLGLSQNALAKRAGVSRQWISEFESGKTTAELGLAFRLLDALDLSLSIETPATRSSPADGPETVTIDLDAILDTYHGR